MLLNPSRLAELAEQSAWEQIKNSVSVSVLSYDRHERGFKVEINIDFDDVGGDSYNPDVLVFDQNGVELDRDADVGELVEEQVQFEE